MNYPKGFDVGDTVQMRSAWEVKQEYTLENGTVYWRVNPPPSFRYIEHTVQVDKIPEPAIHEVFKEVIKKRL